MATFGNIETEVEPIAGLIRDHTETFELVTRAREATEDAVATGTAASSNEALELLRDLEAYLAEDLVIHIAKEEEVLFPALRGFAADIDKVVDEMVEQHDEVRLRKANIERALAALDDAHDEVAAQGLEFSERLREARENGISPKSLAELLDAVKRLDWILQGHFGDEEDDLFVPALDLLSAETLTRLAEESRALDSF